MKKILPLMILLVLLQTAGKSQQQVSPAEARTAALNTMRYNRRMYSEHDISTINTYESRGNTLIYEVKFNDNHSVLLSGSKACLPVLGYNFSDDDETILDKFDMVPPGLQSMIEEYIEQIEICFATDTITLWHETDWNELMKFNKNKVGIVDVVSPLIKTKWGQSFSNDKYNIDYNAYNYYVTETGSACNEHCPTGCVATAMAQIMNYWKHPVYQPSYGSRQFDWCNMPDSLSITHPNYIKERDAVAWLMRKCGIEADMDYCVDGDCQSGAYTKDARKALDESFGYNGADLRRKFWHQRTWTDDVKHDLNNRWPILYSGSDGVFGEGHAFVCDGYRSDNTFHFNWGWNGIYNHYWLSLSSLTFGDYNFNSGQQAVFNIFPYSNDSYCNYPMKLEIYYWDNIVNNIVNNILINNTLTMAVPKTFSVIESVGRESYLGEEYRTIYDGESNEYVAHKRVILKDGFHAEEGSHFVSYIDECESCDDSDMDESRFEGAGMQEVSLPLSTPPANQNAIDVFPNPNDGSFYIWCGGNIREEKIDVQMFDAIGKPVYIRGDGERYTMTSHRAGVYFLRIVLDDMVVSKKIIVQ